MKTMLTLSAQEVKQLQQFIKRFSQGKAVFRAVVILLLGKFEKSTVSKLFNLSERTLYHRKNHYQMDKMASFKDKKRSGRPSKLSSFMKKYLAKLVTESPQGYGYCWSKWTCRSLKIHLEKTFGIEVSLETIRQALIEEGKSWKMPRHMVNSPDPLHDEKVAKIEAVTTNLKENEVLLFQDESDFNLFCPLRKCWQDKGQQIEVETPRQNQRIYAFGAYDYQSKRLVYGTYFRKRTTEFIHFLNHVLHVYPKKKIYMVLDNYCVHHSKRVKNLLEKNKGRLEFLFLPTYAPKYNLIERIWGTIKDWVNCNHLYPNKQALLRGTRRGLRQYQQEWRAAKVA